MRECEVKLELRSTDESRRIYRRAVDLGFRDCGFRVTELDFLPDTSDFKCRERGILLRFRRSRRDGRDEQFVLTLKTRRSDGGAIQDHDELECPLDDFRGVRRALDAANARLGPGSSIPVPRRLPSFETFSDVYRFAVHDLGLVRRRALVEKRRGVLVHGDVVLAIDEFPEDVGRFLEVETRTPEELDAVVERLGLPRDRLDSRTYGKVVAAKRAHHPAREQRTCLFDETRLELEDELGEELWRYA